VRQSLPQVKLQIAGRDPAPQVLALADDCVTVHPNVADMRPFLARATMSIVPLKNGAGTRLKILEAWAMQKAVVATSVGAEGLAGEHQQQLWLANDPAGFAAAVVQLIEQPAVRQRLGAGGRALVERQYSLRAAAGRLDELYERIAA
jgi:glycosyltransferase involved in cell wall biosynthesis